MQRWLILADLLVWCTYLAKGFLKVKIKAELDIRKHRHEIRTRHVELEEIKTVNDEEVIKKFADTIFISNNVSGKTTSSIFNLVMGFLSKRARQAILQG